MPRYFLLAMLFSLLALGCATMQTGTTGDAAGFDLQGHRGARGLLPENSIPGFLRALDLGVTTLEMDVVVAGDSTVVVSHDPWMAATICATPDGTPVTLADQRAHRIFAMTYEEVARYDCGSRGHSRFPDQQPLAVAKPRLRDVIEAAEAHAAATGRPAPRYNIETKARPAWDGTFTPPPEPFTRLLYDVLAETGVKDRASIQSFDVRTLQVARQLDSAWEIVLLIDGEDDRGLDANLAALGFAPDIYSPHYGLVDADLVAAAHARGLRVIPWTVNTREEMEALVALGVDGLITDYPDVGMAVVRAR